MLHPVLNKSLGILLKVVHMLRIAKTQAPWVVWTSELSPFGLKVILLCRYHGLQFRVLPEQGTTAERIRYSLRRELLTRGVFLLTWPRMTAEDEFPLVPFLFGPDGENLYDSTAIAEWFDQRTGASRRLLPDDSVAHFVAALIDDYADEFGLYMVHHNRWKVSALDNDASERLVRELGIPGLLKRLVMARWQRRQTERLPYLFSVAPEGFYLDGLPADVQPPSRPGFPATHALLEEAFERLIGILDTLLRQRPFVLGERMTLADAALYGQLGMNLSDPSACRWMQSRAPALHAWLLRLHRGDATLLQATGELQIDAALEPLLAEIGRVFVPLMQQNLQACERWQAQGEVLFNEPAFDAGRALYCGKIDGHDYRHVAKTFQAKVWRQRMMEWQALPVAVQTAWSGFLNG